MTNYCDNDVVSVVLPRSVPSPRVLFLLWESLTLDYSTTASCLLMGESLGLRFGLSGLRYDWVRVVYRVGDYGYGYD